MTEKERDSGISCENESLSSTSSCPNRVQLLRQRFECLAKEQEKEFHVETNWWLNEVDDGIEEEQEDVEETSDDLRNQWFKQNSSDSVDVNRYSKQSSIKSQLSRGSEGDRTIVITPSTPNTPSNDQHPTIIFTDYQGADETNDSDSFDSADDEGDVFNDESNDLTDLDNFNRNSLLRISRPVSISSQTSTVSSKLHNIVRELLENEENYVNSLKTGIENYWSVLDRKGIPKTLRGQRHRIFANIRSIYSLHQYEFLPALVQCDENAELIAEVFTSFVSRDFFYGYIIYAINRKRSERLCNYDNDFWKKIQQECGDRLGINSFLLQPIQRLPRYQLLMNEIIKDLSKDLENTKTVIASCCVAEKNIQRLITTVNESMSINDIRNCFEIDVLDQGKFKKMDEFDIYDWELRRRFRGKVFLFERGVIYTEALNREYMEFRGHFGSDALGIIYKEGKSKFKLFAKRRGQKEVEFRANLNTVTEWNEIITGILMKFVEEEKKRNAKRKTSLIMLRPGNTNNRNSTVSTLSDQSYHSMSSYRSSSGNSSLGRESYDPRKSQWYI